MGDVRDVVVTGWTKADGETLWMEHDGEPMLRAGRHPDNGPNRAIHLVPVSLAARGAVPEVNVIHIPAGDKLDPIIVYFEDEKPGQGRMTIACYGDAWTAWWGSMGDRTVRQFVAGCDAGYLSGAMCQLRAANGMHRDYAWRVAARVISALAAAPIPQQPEADGDLVLVERGLLGAACSAIDKKRDAPKVVEALRKITMSPAGEDDKVGAFGERFIDGMGWVVPCSRAAAYVGAIRNAAFAMAEKEAGQYVGAGSHGIADEPSPSAPSPGDALSLHGAAGRSASRAPADVQEMAKPMTLEVAFDFADNPRPYHSLACPADTNSELYRALKVLAAETRRLSGAQQAAKDGAE